MPDGTNVYDSKKQKNLRNSILAFSIFIFGCGVISLLLASSLNNDYRPFYSKTRFKLFGIIALPSGSAGIMLWIYVFKFNGSSQAPTQLSSHSDNTNAFNTEVLVCNIGNTSANRSTARISSSGDRANSPNSDISDRATPFVLMVINSDSASPRGQLHSLTEHPESPTLETRI